MLRWILLRDDDHCQKTVKCSWFVGVEKRAVLAEVVMCFGDPRVTDKRRCLQVMRKLLYLLNQGETFTKSEAAALLYSATKLFRFRDSYLRRLVYLIAEELCPIAEEGGMLESALCKDLYWNNHREMASLRPTAVRLLCRITNVPSSINIEESLKDSIENGYAWVSRAGLVCALHLLKKNPRSFGEVGTFCELVGRVAAKSFGFLKFYALCLFSRMQEIETIRELARPHRDKMLSRLLKQEEEELFNSHPLYACLAIRLITQPQIDGANQDYWKYIKWCLEDSSLRKHQLGTEMVAVEILYSVMQLRNVSGRQKAAVVEAVRSRLPSHQMVFSPEIDRMQLPDCGSYVQKPLFLNVRRSMLKWSRIQNHLQPDQLAKSKPQGPAPAIDDIIATLSKLKLN